MMGKDNELLLACKTGNVTAVERIIGSRSKRQLGFPGLKRNSFLAKRDDSGYTALHHASLNGHVSIASLLLSTETDNIVVKDKKGCVPIHLACWAGHRDVVKALLVHDQFRRSINIQNTAGETPLHLACQYGHVAIVNLLLQHNADAQTFNEVGETPLDLAARFGRSDVVHLLVTTRPSLVLAPSYHSRAKNWATADDGSISKNGLVPVGSVVDRPGLPPFSALHLAARQGKLDVVKILLKAGFDINFLTEQGTALHEAALFGRADVVAFLLESGIDSTIRNSDGLTATDVLAQHEAKKSVEITQLLNSKQTWQHINQIIQHHGKSGTASQSAEPWTVGSSINSREGSGSSTATPPPCPTDAGGVACAEENAPSPGLASQGLEKYHNVSPPPRRAVWMQLPENSLERLRFESEQQFSSSTSPGSHNNAPPLPRKPQRHGGSQRLPSPLSAKPSPQLASEGGADDSLFINIPSDSMESSILLGNDSPEKISSSLSASASPNAFVEHNIKSMNGNYINSGGNVSGPASPLSIASDSSGGEKNSLASEFSVEQCTSRTKQVVPAKPSRFNKSCNYKAVQPGYEFLPRNSAVSYKSANHSHSKSAHPNGLPSYDNVPTCMLQYDNAPPGHIHWSHDCGCKRVDTPGTPIAESSNLQQNAASGPSSVGGGGGQEGSCDSCGARNNVVSQRIGSDQQANADQLFQTGVTASTECRNVSIGARLVRDCRPAPPPRPRGSSSGEDSFEPEDPVHPSVVTEPTRVTSVFNERTGSYVNRVSSRVFGVKETAEEAVLHSDPSYKPVPSDAQTKTPVGSYDNVSYPRDYGRSLALVGGSRCSSSNNQQDNHYLDSGLPGAASKVLNFDKNVNSINKRQTYILPDTYDIRNGATIIERPRIDRSSPDAAADHSVGEENLGKGNCLYETTHSQLVISREESLRESDTGDNSERRLPDEIHRQLADKFIAVSSSTESHQKPKVLPKIPASRDRCDAVGKEESPSKIIDRTIDSINRSRLSIDDAVMDTRVSAGSAVRPTSAMSLNSPTASRRLDSDSSYSQWREDFRPTRDKGHQIVGNESYYLTSNSLQTNIYKLDDSSRIYDSHEAEHFSDPENLNFKQLSNIEIEVNPNLAHYGRSVIQERSGSNSPMLPQFCPPRSSMSFGSPSRSNPPAYNPRSKHPPLPPPIPSVSLESSTTSSIGNESPFHGKLHPPTSFVGVGNRAPLAKPESDLSLHGSIISSCGGKTTGDEATPERELNPSGNHSPSQLLAVGNDRLIGHSLSVDRPRTPASPSKMLGSSASTPEFPPPSAWASESKICEKIMPLKESAKRRSMDLSHLMSTSLSGEMVPHLLQVVGIDLHASGTTGSRPAVPPKPPAIVRNSPTPPRLAAALFKRNELEPKNIGQIAQHQQLVSSAGQVAQCAEKASRHTSMHYSDSCSCSDSCSTGYDSVAVSREPSSDRPVSAMGSFPSGGMSGSSDASPTPVDGQKFDKTDDIVVQIPNLADLVTPSASVGESVDMSGPADEWSKNSMLGASFSTGNSVSPNSIMMDSTSSGISPALLNPFREFLNKNQLTSIADDLICNGFDSLTYLPLITDQVIDSTFPSMSPDVRSRLRSSAISLPIVPTSARATGHAFVSDWMHALEADEYLGHLMRAGYDTMTKVTMALDDVMLQEVGITKIGIRLRVLWSLGKQFEILTTTKALQPDKTEVKHQEIVTRRSKSPVEIQETAKLSKLRQSLIAFLEDATGLFGSSKSNGKNSYEDNQKTTKLQPAVCDVGVPVTVAEQWKHDPERLTKGHVAYSAHYLGSHRLVYVDGIPAYIDAMNEIKKRTREIAKVPQVVLQISFTGVNIVNAANNKAICEHAVHEIERAVQDETDRNCFAYVAIDEEKHFCHVFSVLTADLATEVILTLGQAFEVAYQMALQDASSV